LFQNFPQTDDGEIYDGEHENDGKGLFAGVVAEYGEYVPLADVAREHELDAAGEGAHEAGVCGFVFVGSDAFVRGAWPKVGGHLFRRNICNGEGD